MEVLTLTVTWGIYQRIIAAYRHPNKPVGKTMMRAVIAAVSAGVPAALVELRRLGRTPDAARRRRAGVL